MASHEPSAVSRHRAALPVRRAGGALGEVRGRPEIALVALADFGGWGDVLCFPPMSDSHPATARRFMVLLHPCRPDFWATLSPEEQATIVVHYEHLEALQERGAVEFGGRAQDDSYGFLILTLDSEEAVREAFQDNPATTGGLLRLEIQPYQLALDDQPD